MSTMLRPKNHPFLRWAGSKRRLLPDLMAFWSDDFARYVEPFMGSACLFFAIAPKKACINDLNEDLVRTFKAIKKHPAKVYDAYNNIPVTKEFYYKLRPRAFESSDEIERAANFLYLNRNSFNGLYRTNKLGKFNVPFSSNRTGSILERGAFLSSAKMLQTAKLSSLDFESFLRKTVERGDFVYLDPPYAIRNQRIFTQYGPDTFGLNDIERLAKVLYLIDQRGANFVLSYADCDDSRELRRDWSVRKARIRHNIAGFASHRKYVDELIISNVEFATPVPTA